MKKIYTVNYSKIMVLCAILLIILTTKSFANKEDNYLEDSNKNLEYGTSVTYDVETKQIQYGIDQNNVSYEKRTISNENEFEISPYAVIDKDTREIITNTTDSPYRNICYVEATYPDGTTFRGSGTLVYFNVLLTAGHVVYSHEHGGWATSLIVVPGMKDYNTRPLGSAVSTRLTTNNAWINNQDYEWDWAIVDLNTSFSTWQLFGYYKDYRAQIDKYVMTVGYPSDQGTNMYCDTNKVIDAGDRYLKVLCDIVGGDSGGAVIEPSSGLLVGIVSYQHKDFFGNYDYNGMVRMNEDLYNRITAHQKEVQ